jgi:hypothetical protein
MSNGSQSNGDSYKVKVGETVGSIARKFSRPGWKQIYNVNKEVIGENPDLLKENMELTIPGIDMTCGNARFEAKGAEPSEYTGGVKYRYPWVPFSFSMGTRRRKLFTEKDESGNHSTKLSNDLVYEITNKITGGSLVSGTISKSDQLEILLPHAPVVQIKLRLKDSGRKSTCVTSRENGVWYEGDPDDAVLGMEMLFMTAGCVMDGHMHIQSSACSPLPLLYDKFEQVILIDPSTKRSLRKRETLENLVSHLYHDIFESRKQC